MDVVGGVRSFIRRSMRVLLVSYHPTPEEFKMTAKVTALGMVIIGLVGYLIALLFRFMEGM